MYNPLSQVAAIHDLSGYGRSSLTVIIPILATMGCEVLPLPTAILSSHTGYKNFVMLDLTEQMPKFIKHWQELNLKFKAIYSGFLGSPKQVDIVCNFIDTFQHNNLLTVVDPVMGDNGQLYPSYSMDMVPQMRKLCSKALLITPNVTEASLLLKKPFPKTLTEKEIKEWLLALADLGPQKTVITSVPLVSKPNSSVVVAYDKDDGRFWLIERPRIPVSYEGTGDMFTSVLLGSLMQGDNLPLALDRSANFVATAIRATFGYGSLEHHEILLEKSLNTLTVPFTNSSYELF